MSYMTTDGWEVALRTNSAGVRKERAEMLAHITSLQADEDTLIVIESMLAEYPGETVTEKLEAALARLDNLEKHESRKMQRQLK